MRYTTLLLSFLSICNLALNAQTLVPPSTNPKTLEEKFHQKFLRDSVLARQVAKERNILLRWVDENGRTVEFSHFDPKGEMLFNITDNLGAGRTISTNKVWPGEVVGTSLTGSTMSGRLGEWDGGGVLTTHQELTGRVTQVDGASPPLDHSTHVAGTMIAKGADANAKGMAYQANLKAYDWANDKAEMQSAAANGLLLSNHSYGSVAGWYNVGGNWYWMGDQSISQVEDWKYGFYDSESADWDEIAWNNPYYLICKAAGNDRGNNAPAGSTWYWWDTGTQGTGTMPPAVGPYDCLPTNANAKNVLTVGAVYKINNSNNNNGWTKVSDVIMSTFSGWGPSDDGRIKPDVVGCGVDVYSSVTTNNTAYDTYSGTSMATPNVTGSLLLVQEHYKNVKHTFMRSATLKALAIHTADEAGNPGPDYTYGWGLVNTAKAVKLISDSNINQIQERTLANGASYMQYLTSAGLSPLRITIAWTDPAGTPVAASLDPADKMLVNDLDIQLVRVSDNTFFYPFILDRTNPSANATTGNNSVDNVEQIYIQAPEPGTYVLSVSHKNSLKNDVAQNYSLIISGIMGVPHAVIEASSRSVCMGEQVTFTDVSNGSPTQRKWYFPGGNPSTSTNASVTVSYSTIGAFPVALTVSNALGSDSVYRANYISVGGMTLPFNESFESNSPTAKMWSIDNPDIDTTWRTATIGGTTPGNTAYCLPFYNYSSVGKRDGLITPALSFRGYASATLSFTHAYTRYPGTPSDSLILYISTDCGSNWTRIYNIAENGSMNFRTTPDNYSEFIPAASSEWCVSNCISVNLNAYVGASNIKIKFQGYNNNGNDLYIDNVNITGTALPVTAGFYSSKQTACVGEPVDFYDSTQNIATNWNWSFNGANTTSSTIQNPIGIVYSIPGTYDVTLKVSNSTNADSITKIGYITVLDIPVKPNIKNNSTTLTFCEGDSIILSTDSIGTSYQWLKNGTIIPGETSASLVVKESGGYRVALVNSNGCATPSDGMIATKNTILSVPIITPGSSDGNFCPGTNILLVSSADTGNQWFRNNTLIPGATLSSYVTSDTGSYTVKVSGGACPDETSLPQSVGLYSKPVTSSINGPTTSNNSKTETYSVTNTTGSTYKWIIMGGTQVSGTTTNSIKVLWGSSVTSGKVQVIESSNHACKGDTQTLNVTITVGIDELHFIKQVSLYPNPANQVVTMNIESGIRQEATVRFINLLGQTLSETSWSIAPGNNQQQFSLGSLSKGVYFVEIETNGERLVKRLVIQ